MGGGLNHDHLSLLLEFTQINQNTLPMDNFYSMSL